MLENIDYPNKKIAIILFNLGGPDSLNSVKPFLFNLFNDPAIISLPQPMRWILAKFISTFREKKAQKLYAIMGNKSPILNETLAQSQALSNKLKLKLKNQFKIFIAMRYWHPRAEKIIDELALYKPTEIIILPLYPQFSTTTTGSSIQEFKEKISLVNFGNDIAIKTVCCYPQNEDFIKSHVTLIQNSINQIADQKNYRILFSAHSLPVKIIKAGDPYQCHVEKTVKNILEKLALNDLDYKITYQSKVGPIEWLKPSTEEEVKIAGREGKALIIVPVAFVSEHVETLVELDVEYKAIADNYKIPYFRVPALGINDFFIDSLSKIVINFSNAKSGIICNSNFERVCPSNFLKCPCNL